MPLISRGGLRARVAQRIDTARRLADVLPAHDATFCVKVAVRLSCVRSTV